MVLIRGEQKTLKHLLLSFRCVCCDLLRKLSVATKQSFAIDQSLQVSTCQQLSTFLSFLWCARQQHKQ